MGLITGRLFRRASCRLVCLAAPSGFGIPLFWFLRAFGGSWCDSADAASSGPEDGVAGLVVGNRLEVHVHLAFGGLYLEA